jgi:hypothetical protein
VGPRASPKRVHPVPTPLSSIWSSWRALRGAKYLVVFVVSSVEVHDAGPRQERRKQNHDDFDGARPAVYEVAVEHELVRFAREPRVVQNVEELRRCRRHGMASSQYT